MQPKETAPQDIDEYLAAFPSDIQALLSQMRAVIHAAAPDAQEAIKYGMPTFTLKSKNLVHFAAHQKHIGFYPTPAGIKQFKDELAAYEQAKGTIRFALNTPIPFELIRKIVQFRAQELLAKTAAKAKSKKS